WHLVDPSTRLTAQRALVSDLLSTSTAGPLTRSPTRLGLPRLRFTQSQATTPARTPKMMPRRPPSASPWSAPAATPRPGLSERTSSSSAIVVGPPPPRLAHGRGHPEDEVGHLLSRPVDRFTHGFIIPRRGPPALLVEAAGGIEPP